MICGVDNIYNYNPFASSFPPGAKLSAYQNQSKTHQNSVFRKRGQTKDLQFRVMMLFLSLFPMFSHIFTFDVPSLFMLILLLIFGGVNFQFLCESAPKLLCGPKVTS
jgi:hypothetical protein